MAKANKTVESKKEEIIPIKEVKRKVHYYELKFEFNDNLDTEKAINKEPFNAFFTIIAKMARDKEALRYQEIFDAKIFVQDVAFDEKVGGSGKTITGKFRYVKMDVFPEILNIVEDTTRDIEATDMEGIVETTHFMIDLTREVKYLVLEYNHAGAKFADFIAYCEKIGQAKNVLEEINSEHYSTVVRDELSTFQRRINQVSGFTMKIHKNNFAQIEGINKGLFSTLKLTNDQYNVDYIEMHLKFSLNKKKTKKEQPIRNAIRDLIASLTEDKEKTNLFDTLRTTAQDGENHLKMHTFDLLADKVTSEISVQLRPKRKVIISESIFEKMNEEYINKRI